MSLNAAPMPMASAFLAAGQSTIRMIRLRAPSDLQGFAKHENGIVQGIAAASVEVCDKPVPAHQLILAPQRPREHHKHSRGQDVRPIVR